MIKNNKRAFTLTELIAVIVILGVILVIAIPTYNNHISKTRDRVYETYVSKSEDAAKTFVEYCISKNECPNGTGKLENFIDPNANKKSYISLKTLKDNNYIEKITDPKTKAECTGGVYFGYDVNYGDYEAKPEYKYAVCISCNGKYYTNLASPSECINYTPKLIVVGSKPDLSLNFNPVDTTETTKEREVTIILMGNIEGISSDDLKYFVGNAHPTSVGELMQYTSNNPFSIGNGITGERYLFVKQLKNKDGLKSTSIDAPVTISGKLFHRYGPFTFDNTAPTCELKLKSSSSYYKKYEITTTALSSELSSSPYSWKSNTSGFNSNNESKYYTSSDNGKTVKGYIKDKYGNTRLCGSANVNGLLSANPTLTFSYTKASSNTSYTPGTWTKENVKIRVNIDNKGFPLTKLEYNDPSGSKKTVNNPSTSQEIVISSTVNNYTMTATAFNSVAEATLSGSATGQQIKIDKTAPTTPYVTGIELDSNKSTLIFNTDQTKYKFEGTCDKSNITTDATCTLKYFDPDDTGFFKRVNSTPAQLKLTFSSVDNQSGLSSKLLYSDQNNSSWVEVTPAELNTKIQNIVNTIDNGEKNIFKIYLKSKDMVGNESPKLTLGLFRKTNHITGW